MARTSTSGVMKSHGESTNHFNAIRLRVLGIGNLKLNLLSLPNYSGDPVTTLTLTPVVMSTSTAIQPTVLSNFVGQRAQLELTTTELNEVFKINRIIIFVRPIASGYPQ